MKNLLKIAMAILILLIVSCSSDENNYSIDQVESVDLASDVYQDSNAGMYNGVFTTLDGEQRGSVEITIPADNSRNATAVITLASGEIISLLTNDVIQKDYPTENVVFGSETTTLSFSVDANGRNPQVNQVRLNDVQGDVLIRKHTSRAPVVPIPGAYICTDCGTHPVLNNSTTQTFNFLMFTAADGDSSFDTQVTLGMNTFTGTGTQNTCVVNGVQTNCAISGSFSVSGAPITWSGGHTFNNEVTGMQDCSGASGTWSFTSVNFGTIVGTFASTVMCPPPPVGPLVDEDFEDNTFEFTPSSPLFHDGGNDYVTIVPLNGDGETDIVRPAGSSNHFGVEDMDDGSNNRPETVNLDWTGLDVSSFTSVAISGLFAESNSNGSETWDSNSSVRVEVSLDNGTFTPVIAFENSSTNPSEDNSNLAPLQDTDFDGIGDGAELTNTLTSYSANVNTTTANTLTVRIVITGLTGTQEDIAIDNFLVEGS